MESARGGGRSRLSRGERFPLDVILAPPQQQCRRVLLLSFELRLLVPQAALLRLEERASSVAAASIATPDRVVVVPGARDGSAVQPLGSRQGGIVQRVIGGSENAGRRRNKGAQLLMVHRGAVV